MAPGSRRRRPRSGSWWRCGVIWWLWWLVKGHLVVSQLLLEQVDWSLATDTQPEPQQVPVEAGRNALPKPTIDDAQDMELVCAYDELHVRVEFGFSKRLTRQEKASLGLFLRLVRAEQDQRQEPSTPSISGHGQLIHSKRLSVQPKEQPPQQHPPEEQEEHTDSVTVLQCDLDPEFCLPRIVSIQLPDHLTPQRDDFLKPNETLVVVFEQDTNRPLLSNKEAIEQVLRFEAYLAEDLQAVWKTPRHLEIKLMQIDTHKQEPLFETIQKLKSTSVRVSHEDIQSLAEEDDEEQPASSTQRRYLGAVSFRIGLPGTYQFELVTELRQVITDQAISRGFRVVLCSDAVLVPHDIQLDQPVPDPTTLPTTLFQQQATVALSTPSGTVVPPPSYAFHGVLSHAGHQGHAIPNNTIQMQQQLGTWSLSFWVFLTEDSTGQFRTLFYKGDGISSHRTPSAWLLPNERRLALRVSSVVGMDVGIDTKGHLALNEWVHLVFVFRNCSSGTNATTAKVLHQVEGCGELTHSDKPWHYGIHFYLNGLLDRHMLVFAPVLANDGALQIGNAPGLDGFRGFISDLAIYPIALSEQAIRQVFVDESRHHVNFRKSSLLRQANKLSGITNQIAFLGQLLPKMISVKKQLDEEASATLKAQYQHAIELLSKCDSGGVDIVRESAEFGLPEALRDLGEAFLYGEFVAAQANSSCSRATMPLDAKQAELFLGRAFVTGQFDAAKPLALLKSLSRHGMDDEDRIDDQEAMESRLLSRCIGGLYHFAATSGRLDAYAVLGREYFHGDGVTKDLEVASFYYYHAAVEASVAYHAHGNQPLIEMNGLYDAKEEEIVKGQRGDDDELIQFQKMRADKDGDVEAMAAMGELYYWGARGMQRDQRQAAQYFQRAAQGGHVSSMAALAGMLLKGEGLAQDNKTAIHLYEQAARANHTRALNGLGFAYFHGTGGLQQNKTLALQFFERAAANQEDGDSVFNAGYCYAMGLGTPVNMTKAMDYYGTAARQFGHFDAVFELGKLWLHGVEDEQAIARNPKEALVFLRAASDAGPWSKRVRQGFNRFLAQDYDRAVVLYHDALEHGYAIAKSNLAFLYDRKIAPQSGGLQDQKRALAFLHQAVETNHQIQAMTRIGDYHLFGLAGLQPNTKQALRWYSRASASGDPEGAFNAGQLYETGGPEVEANLDRAERYYKHVLELSSSPETFVTVQLALLRLTVKRYAPEWLFVSYQRLGDPDEDADVEEQEKSILHQIGTRVQSSWLQLICFTASLGYVGVLYFNRQHQHHDRNAPEVAT